MHITVNHGQRAVAWVCLLLRPTMQGAPLQRSISLSGWRRTTLTRATGPLCRDNTFYQYNQFMYKFTLSLPGPGVDEATLKGSAWIAWRLDRYQAIPALPLTHNAGLISRDLQVVLSMRFGKRHLILEVKSRNKSTKQQVKGAKDMFAKESNLRTHLRAGLSFRTLRHIGKVQNHKSTHA